MKFAESQLISMHAMVYAVLTQPYTHARGVWPSYTMACILITFLRVHTLSAVALISMAAVVQTCIHTACVKLGARIKTAILKLIHK